MQPVFWNTTIDFACRRRLSGKHPPPDTTPPTVPVHKPSFLPSRTTSTLRATWLGHACYYVEFPSGLRVLFDPVFTDRCSPFSFLGPKRYTDAPCQIADIPFVDACVISHVCDHRITAVNFTNRSPRHTTITSPSRQFERSIQSFLMSTFSRLLATRNGLQHAVSQT